MSGDRFRSGKGYSGHPPIPRRARGKRAVYDAATGLNRSAKCAIRVSEV